MALTHSEKTELDTVIDSILYMQKSFTGNDELIKEKAEFCSKYYKALIAAGFSPPDAIEILKAELSAQRSK